MRKEIIENVTRPGPLEDAILRMIKKYESCAQDKGKVFGKEARDTYFCVASELVTILKGEYVIGWDNDNSNIGWIPCEIKMPEDCEKYKGKKIIDVLVTTDRGKVTIAIQQIIAHNDTNETTLNSLRYGYL